MCWIADCWGHHAQLPQILRQCGYEHYAFMRCMRRDVMRNDFRWRGLDGTAIRTHWFSTGYAGLRFPTTATVVNALELDLRGCGPDDVRRLLAEQARFGDGGAALLCNGGDMAFPQASAPAVLRRLAADGALPPIAFSTPERCLGAIDWDQTPEIGGEFTSALQGSFTTNIRIKQRNRRLSHRLQDLEALAACLGAPLPDADELWKPVLKQQFHDIICGTIADGALDDCLREFDAAERSIEAALARLPADGAPAWFNPLSWSRAEVVGPDDARTVVELPALGWTPTAACHPTAPAALPALPTEFSNAWYHARIDAHGAITSLVTLHDGRELVSAGAPCPFGALTLQLDHGDSWLNFVSPLNGGSSESNLVQDDPDPYERIRPGVDITAGTMVARPGTARVVAASDAELAIEIASRVSYWRLGVDFTTRVTFSRLHPRIEYRTVIRPAGRHYRLRAVFPTTLSGGTVRHEVPFGLQQRGAGEHVAYTFADCSLGQGGLALVNDGTPASNVCDGTLMLTLFRAAAMEYKCDSVASHAEGVEHVFRYAVIPHAGDLAEVGRLAHAFGRPPVACRAGAATGSSGWSVDAPGVRISGLRPAADGGVFLRVHETIGAAASVRLGVPEAFVSWCEADGLERATGAVTAIAGGAIRLGLRPWSIRHLLLRRASG